MKVHLATLAAITTVALAAPAHANDTDGAFLRRLVQDGLATPGQNALLMGNEGRFVCNAAGMGYTQQVIRWKVQDDHKGFSDAQADRFIADSMQTYCQH